MEDTSFVNEKESKILETTEEILFSTSEETTAVGEVIVDNIPTKSKNKTPLLIVLAIAGIAVVAGTILLLIPSKEKQAIRTANSYIEAENYQEAINTLTQVEQTTEIVSLQENIYNLVENNVEELLDDKDYKEALKLLDQWEVLPAHTELTNEALEGWVEELISEGEYKEAFTVLSKHSTASSYDTLSKTVLEKHVEELMNNGQYTDAITVLSDHKSVSNFKELYNQVKWESIILECAFNLRPNMKNPSSLQITSVEAYNTSSSDATYPAIILQSSGQNGFGGYSTSLVAFSTTDLSLLGSTSTMDRSDTDDYTELLIILLIDTYRTGGNDIKDFAFDLSRINNFLTSGKKPELNISVFKNENTTEANL